MFGCCTCRPVDGSPAHYCQRAHASIGTTQAAPLPLVSPDSKPLPNREDAEW